MSDLAVTWLGHSTVTIDVGGVRLLTDPLLGAHPHPLRRRFPAPDPALWQHPDAILLSHLHHDHADLPSLRRLSGVPVLSGPTNAAWAQRRGLRGVGLSRSLRSLAELLHSPAGSDDAPAGPDRLAEVQIGLAPAEHHSRPMPHRPNEAHGQLVRTSRWRIHVVGDTSLYEELDRVPEWLDGVPDLVLVPIAGWGPRLSPGHLGPVEAAELCRRTGARRALAVHWGTLHPPLLDRATGSWSSWMDAPIGRFVIELSRLAPSCEVIDVRPGQTWTAP